MSDEARLVLYRFDGCPWCERVRAAVADLGLQIDERDIRADPGAADELRAATGRGRVPVLRIENDLGQRWLPESADIVQYLYEQYGEGRRPTFLASTRPQVIGRFLAIALLIASLLAQSPVRQYLLAAALVVFVFRNSLPLVRLLGPAPARMVEPTVALTPPGLKRQEPMKVCIAVYDLGDLEDDLTPRCTIGEHNEPEVALRDEQCDGPFSPVSAAL